jgi:outer membrane protein OmpA-like peptidoglycan-associated protein
MNRSVLLLSIAIAFGLAGCSRLAYQEGMSALSLGRDTEAARSLEVAERGTTREAASGALAMLYLKQHRYDEALSRFRQLESVGKLTSDLALPYAQCFVALGRYDEAIPRLQALSNTDPAAAKLLEDIAALGLRTSEELLQVHAIEVSPRVRWRWMRRFKQFETTSTPVIYDSTLYFSATTRRWLRRGVPPTDLWQAPFDLLPDPDGTYRVEATPLKGLNSPFHDAAPAFHPDGRTVVFSRTDVPVAPTWKERLKLPSSWVLDHPIQLFTTTVSWPDGYEQAMRLPFCDGMHRFAHPAFSADGSTLYFTSDRPGGYGGTDLWSVVWNGTTWGEPVNCGSAVNTAENEAFPSLTGDTLWFSSDGHRSVGGLDLLYSLRTPRGWGDPVDVLPEPLNSSRDDFAAHVVADPAAAGQVGVFSSERTGKDALYLFHRRPWTVDLVVHVVLDANGSPVSGISGTLEFPGSSREPVPFTTDFGGDARMTFARPDSVRIVLPDAVDCDPTTFRYPQDAAIRYHEVEERIAFWQRRGCVDPVACNFDSEATVVDWALCVYAQPMRKCNGDCLYDWDKDGLCDEECDPRRFEKGENLKTAVGPDPRTVTVPPYGCTYPNACNFDPNATRDNGTCDFVSCFGERPPTARLPRTSGGAENRVVPGTGEDPRSEGSTWSAEDPRSEGSTWSTEDPRSEGSTWSAEDRKTAEGLDSLAARPPATEPMNRPTPSIPRGIEPDFPENDNPLVDEMNLFWDLDKAEVRPQHRPELSLMADYLREHPASRVLITSHCDARASQNYNDRLSRRRSDAVRQELVARGVRPDQMVSLGRSEDVLGRDCPDGNCDEEVLQGHRKSEVRFISPDMKYIVHRVGPGETLQSVAKLHGIPTRNLMEINELEEPFVRQEQELLIALPRN